MKRKDHDGRGYLAVMIWVVGAFAAAPGASATPPNPSPSATADGSTAELRERVVARIAGGDVDGAASTLAFLGPLYRWASAEAEKFVDRLNLRLRAARGMPGVLEDILGTNQTGPEVGWLIAEAVRGVAKSDPVAASLLAALVPPTTSAGRQAHAHLAAAYLEHGLVQQGVSTLTSILGRPEHRLRRVPRRLVAGLTRQSDPAAETERGWMLYDLHASKSARKAFIHATIGLKAEDDAFCWAWIGLARASFTQRDFKAAQQALRRALDAPRCGRHPELPEAMVRLARNAFVAEDKQAVERAASWLEHHAPEWGEQHGVTALPVLLNRDARALRGLARKVRKRLAGKRWHDPVGDLAMEAFMKLRKQRRFRAAAALLSPLVKAGYRTWRPGRWGQLDYWAARALWEHADRGKSGAAEARTEAIGRWEQLVLRYPQTWYGLLAAQRLRTHAPQRHAAMAKTVATEVSERVPLSVLAGDVSASLADWGLANATSIELATTKVLASAADVRAGAHHLSELGLPSRGTRLAQRGFKLHAPGPVTTDPRGLWRAAWPTPFRDSLTRAVAVTKADPWFVWGVMRTESLFTPTLVSHAGARGLLQLMPGTARWLRRKLKDRRLGGGDMFDPLDNILLGSVFLKRLDRKYEGSKPLMLTAYNAGPGRLNKYLRKMLKKARGRDLPDVAEFVETLPWNEAKNYVRSVVTNWATYRLLYGCGCLSQVSETLPATYLQRLVPKKRKTKRRSRKRR